jgi:hypothetical protein
MIERKMIVLQRCACLQNTRVLSLWILTLGRHSLFMTRIWSFIRVGIMDDLCLLFVQTAAPRMNMRHSHWKLLAKW